jgi:glycosyltransferase involved in cell wall biosynthesis
MITTIILTKDEENCISRCLRSVSWCDEVIVIDDLSEDGTKDEVMRFAQGTKTRIIFLSRAMQGDFSRQRNFALGHTEADWVLYVDADEIVTEELREEILNKIQTRETVFDGFYIKRKDYFCGKWLTAGETARVKFLRLVRRKSGAWAGRVHERFITSGRTDTLSNPLHHFPHATVRTFLHDINFYTNLAAEEWKDQKKTVKGWEILLYPLGKFLSNYFIHGGFRDGTQGFIVATMMSLHSFLLRAKAWSNQEKEG